MSFMQPEIVFGTWHLVDSAQGVVAYPGGYFSQSDALAEYENDSVYSVETVKGWGARLSAPGYMDCTDWTVYKTEQEARDALEEESNDGA